MDAAILSAISAAMVSAVVLTIMWGIGRGLSRSAKAIHRWLSK